MKSKLTLEILRYVELRCQLSVEYVLSSEYLVRSHIFDENEHEKVKTYIKQRLMYQLADALLNSKKIVTLSETKRSDLSIQYIAELNALSDDNLNKLVELAYLKGKQDALDLYQELK